MIMIAVEESVMCTEGVVGEREWLEVSVGALLLVKGGSA